MNDSLGLPYPPCQGELPEEIQRSGQNMSTQKRLCDYCGESVALLYCRADSAKLCFMCDREVHSTNQLFSKHTRFLLCDGCDSSPAPIFCSTESTVLCQNCDWERHSLWGPSVHDRRPFEGFTGYPSVAELLAIWGFDEKDHKALLRSDEIDGGDVLGGSVGTVDNLSDMFLWDTTAVVSLDDLITSAHPSHKFKAMEVPALPKDRNATCGHHKEEILGQLRELAKAESILYYESKEAENLHGLQQVVPDYGVHQDTEFTGRLHFDEPLVHPVLKVDTLHWYGHAGEPTSQVSLPNSSLGSFLDESSTVPGKKSDKVSTPLNSVNRTKAAPQEFISIQDRETALSRYKEKKKTRRYDKHVRYESRKIRAENRTRIRGRFAKVGNPDTDK